MCIRDSLLIFPFTLLFLVILRITLTLFVLQLDFILAHDGLGVEYQLQMQVA